jgi:hypothetical protein
VTRVKCRQRQCPSWDEGVCSAQDIIVDGEGTCLTQDEEPREILDLASVRRTSRAGASCFQHMPDIDTEDDDWEDDDLCPDDAGLDEDDDDWEDDESAEDVPRRE